MEKKKKFIERLNPKKVSNAASTGILVASTIVAGGIGANMGGNYIEKNWDANHISVTQTVYDKKIDEANKDLTYKVALDRATGALPEDFDIEQAKEQLKADMTPQFMEDAKQETDADKKEAKQLRQALNGGLFALISVVANAKATPKATNKLENNIIKAQANARRRREEEDEKTV